MSIATAYIRPATIQVSDTRTVRRRLRAGLDDVKHSFRPPQGEQSSSPGRTLDVRV